MMYLMKTKWIVMIKFKLIKKIDRYSHVLQTPREEIAFTAQPKIQSQSQIFRCGRSIFCLPHRPNFSDMPSLGVRSPWATAIATD